MSYPYLRLIFATNDINKNFVLRIPNAREDLDPSEVQNVANIIIEKDIFTTTPVALKYAHLVTTETEQIIPV